MTKRKLTKYEDDVRRGLRTAQYNGIIDTQLKVIDELKAQVESLKKPAIIGGYNLSEYIRMANSETLEFDNGDNFADMTLPERIKYIVESHASLKAEVERLNELAQDPYRLSRGWQPMETAPKDGTVVLCWDEFKECDLMWYGIIQQWNEPKDILGWMYVATNTECHPTHWMPLPKPPAAVKGVQS